MPSWLKALIVLAALVGGLPSAAWAHVAHEHGPAVETIPGFVAGALLREGPSASAIETGDVSSRPVLYASAFHGLNKAHPAHGGICCCQGAGVSCAPSIGGLLYASSARQAPWDLAALARLSQVVPTVGDRLMDSAPHSRLDRPPKV
jgi:hypothetical protein